MRRSLVSLSLIAAFAAGLWLARLPILQAVAEAAIAARAPLPVSFTLVRIDTGGMTIADIRIGEENPILIGRVEGGFTPGGLFEGRIRDVVVSGVTVPVAMDGDQTRIGDLVLEDGDGAAALPGWTVETLRVEDVAVDMAFADVATAAIRADIRASSELVLADLPLDDPARLLSRFDIDGRIDLSARTGAALPLDTSLLPETEAAGTIKFNLTRGKFQVRSVTPLRFETDYGVVEARIAVSGDTASDIGLQTADGDASLTIDLTNYPLPVAGLNGGARIAGDARVSLADGILKTTIVEGFEILLPGWPIDGESLPAELKDISRPVRAIVSRPLVFRADLSATEFTARGGGAIRVESGPVVASIMGPFSIAPGDRGSILFVTETAIESSGVTYGTDTLAFKTVLKDSAITFADTAVDGTLFVDFAYFTASGTQFAAESSGRLQIDANRLLWLPTMGGWIKARAEDISFNADIRPTVTNRLEIVFDNRSPVQPIKLDFTNALATVGDTKIVFDEFGGKLTLSPDGVSVEMLLSPLYVGGTEMLAGPIKLKARVIKQGLAISLDGTVTTAPGLRARFQAYQSRKPPVVHATTFEAGTEPLTFERDGLQPADVFPFLKLSGPFSGVLSARAFVLNDRDKPPEGFLSFEMAGGAFRNPVFALGGLNGELEMAFETLPASRRDQKAQGHVSFGPVKNAPFELQYSLEPDFGLSIERLSVEGFGGAFGLKDVVVAPGGASATGIIVLDAVDFEALTETAAIDGLYADGVLSGEVPFRIDDQRLTVSDGRLRALGSGRLTYSSETLNQAALTDATMDLLVKALQDFRYDVLSLELALPESGDGSILLNLQGNNPQVLDGQPFNLNINLESDFNKLANDFYLIYEQATRLISQAAQ